MRQGALRILHAPRRIQPGPGLVRLTAFGLAFVALLLALPGPLRDTPWTYLLALGFAAMPAIRPGTAWASAVELIVIGEWLISSMLYAEARGVVAMLALAALLYAHHTTCALATALPLLAKVAPGVIANWLIRTGGVVAVSVVLVLIALAVLPPSGTGRSVPAVALFGLLAAVCAGGVLAFLLHRRR